MLPKQTPTAVRRIPWLTWLFIGLHLLALSWILSLTPETRPFVLRDVAVVPLRDGVDAFSWSSITAVWRSLFLVASLPLLLLNLLTLGLLGPSVEDRLGRLPFLLLYLTGGYLSLLLQLLGEPLSPWPVLGNSGAVAAIAGAFLLLCPTAGLADLPLMHRFNDLAVLPAVALIPLWYIGQLFIIFTIPGVTTTVSLLIIFVALLITFLFGLLMTWFTLQIWPELRPDKLGQVTV